MDHFQSGGNGSPSVRIPGVADFWLAPALAPSLMRRVRSMGCDEPLRMRVNETTVRATRPQRGKRH